jgi:hypothetical protein
MIIIVLSILFFVSFVFGTLIYVFKKSHQQTKEMIVAAEKEGNKVLFRTITGGSIDGIQYKGPFLTVAVFEKFLIVKDKKIMFENMTSITTSTFMGTTIESTNTTKIVIGDSHFLQFVPQEYGGNKGKTKG